MRLKKQIIKREKVYGLDIGDSGVKIALVSKISKGIVLEELSFRNFPIHLESVNNQILMQTLQGLKDELKEEKMSVIVNLYNTEPIVKFLTLPYMDNNELSEAIKWQTQRFIVYDLEKMIIDYAVLDTFEETGKKKVNVVIVAVTKEAVFNLIEILKNVGIEPVSISVDCLAQFYFLRENDVFGENKVDGIIDIGMKNTIIQIVNSGVPCFVRKCTTIGSWEINKALKKTFNIEFEETEKIKRDFFLGLLDMDFDTEVRRIMNQAMEDIFKEIKRSLDYYSDIFPQKKVDRLFLVGGGAFLNNLETYLSQGLGMEVKRFDPFKNIIFSESIKNLELLKNNSLRFTTVLGLALEAIL